MSDRVVHARASSTRVLAALLGAGVWIGCGGVIRAAQTPQSAAIAEAPPPAARTSKPPPEAALRRTYETLPGSKEAPARLRLLAGNVDAWAERWRVLDETESSLDISYFILHEDVFGIAFLGHLLEKAENGVRIRLLLDAFGTKMSRTLRGSDYLDELANAGVEIKIFRPRWSRYLEGLLALDPAVVVASEHDKIIVSDGRRSIIGGRNIGHEYFAHPAAEPEAFHDVDLRLDGARVARALTGAFEVQFESDHAEVAAGERFNLVSRRDELLSAYRAMDAWLHAAPDRSKATSEDLAATDRAVAPWQGDLETMPLLRGALRRPLPAAIEAETRVLDSPARVGGLDADDPITSAIVRLVKGSQKRILVQSPYLVLSEEATELLADAGRRGVEITILTNSPVSSDNALSQAFFLEQWPDLLARVPNLRLFVGGRERTLHAKIAVFDDTVALVGTYNLDPTSMALNSEVVAAVRSRAFARAVAAEPLRMIAAGPPTVYQYEIVRDDRGNPVREEDGEVRVAFGPRDHCTPEQWASLGAYWTMLKAVTEFTPFSPLF